MSSPSSTQVAAAAPPLPPENNLPEDLLSAAENGGLSVFQSLLNPRYESKLRKADLTLDQLTVVTTREKQARIVTHCINLGVVDLESWDVLKGVLNSKSLDVYQVIVPAGYNTNYDFVYVDDALIYAAALDDVPLAEYPLDNAANVDRRFQVGRYSVLTVAAKRAETEMADVLIRKGKRLMILGRFSARRSLEGERW